MISDHRPYMGCDPELFISLNGEVKGSHTIIEEQGVGDQWGKVVRDGVQVELNPTPDCCRAFLSNSISNCFRVLKDKLSKSEMKVDFRRTIELSPAQYEELPEEAKRLGCMPSLSTDPSSMSIGLLVSDEPVLTRSAGGHIHFGHFKWNPSHGAYNHDWYKENDTRVTMIMDLVLANQCVMLDTDPTNAIRRKLYGRAGEYRLPKHGYEYRTLSNFWLIHEAIFSLVFGIARQAMMIAESEKHSEELLSSVDMGFVQHTINTNNVEMAKQTWGDIKDKITGMVDQYQSHPLSKERVGKFDRLVEVGLDNICPPGKWDIVSHWCNIPEGHDCGWGNFDIYRAVNKAKEME